MTPEEKRALIIATQASREAAAEPLAPKKKKARLNWAASAPIRPGGRGKRPPTPTE